MIAFETGAGMSIAKVNDMGGVRGQMVLCEKFICSTFRRNLGFFSFYLRDGGENLGTAH